MVRAPLRASRHQIEQAVAQKADWVRQKQAYAQAHPVAALHRYAPGEKFWFLGNEYPLEIIESLTTEPQRTQRKLFFKNPLSPPLVPPATVRAANTLCLPGPGQASGTPAVSPRRARGPNGVRDGRAGECLSGLSFSAQTGHFLLEQRAQPRAEAAFTAWYKAQARALIEERVRRLAAQHGFSYRQVRMTSARTRWGSCSAKGTLCFTWRLVMAPPECIDYVVVHELAHLRVANHSPAFWREVEAILPDYKARRKWLRANGRLLNL